jgi:hypothetical protein
MRAVLPFYNNNEEMRYENKNNKNDIFRMMMKMMIMVIIKSVNSNLSINSSNG